MPVRLEDIKRPIASQMQEFEKKFRQFVKSDVMLLDNVMNFIVKRKGKQLRPVLVFLSAGMTGTITEATFRGAALIELLHTATLVHDDVVDDSQYRRDFFSVNALWKNKVAVLVGDYLLSRGLLLSIDHDDFLLLRIVSQAVREMSEGELLQLEKARRLDITEEVYFEIIRKKTATLLAACCGVGAASSPEGLQWREPMERLGEKIGIAFQIKDDLFDYGKQEVGKPLGIDIKEKKMTLPLIYALSQAPTSEKRHIIRLIKNHSHEPEKVAEVIGFVGRKGGIEYAKKTMDTLVDEAYSMLKALPQSEYSHAFNQLIAYVIERDK